MFKYSLTVFMLVFGFYVQAQELQEANPHQGAFISASISPGYSWLSGSKNNSVKHAPNMGITLQVGEWVTSSLGFGLSINSVNAIQKNNTFSSTGTLLYAQYAPNHLKYLLGVGFGVSSLKTENKTTTTTGSFISAGVAYDFFFRKANQSGGWAIAPVAHVMWYPGPSITQCALTLGFQGSYNFGIASNKLLESR